jgi:hypothetical protein
MHTIQISISTRKYFDNQKQMAEFLNIKNSSKKAIHSRCKAFGYGVEFDDYYGEYNREVGVEQDEDYHTSLLYGVDNNQ